MHTQFRHRSVLLALAFVASSLLPRLAHADTLTLQWDANPEPEVVGYYVYIGTSPGARTTTVDVGNTTTYAFSSAVPGTTYYFTVAAYTPGPVLGPMAVEVLASSNAAPTLTNPGNQTGTVGVTKTVSLVASDPNGDPITLTALGLPPGLTLNSATRVISGVPTAAGSYTTSLTAMDPDGSLATHSFGWTISTSDTLAPSVVISSPTTAATHTSTAAFVTVGGSATDDVSVAAVTWANSTGGSGSTAGTTSWSVVVPLVAGNNVITITARDGVGRVSTDSISVSYQPPAPAPAPAPTQTPLTVQSLTASKSAPQAPGTTVRFTTAAAGGAGPYQYQYLVHDGLRWTVVRSWATSATFDWKPSKSNFFYKVQVQVRSAGVTANSPGATATVSFPIYRSWW